MNKTALKLLVITVLVWLSCGVKAQTVNPDCVDGTIFVCLTSDQPANFKMNKRAVVEENSLAFLNAFTEKYGITKVRLPFGNLNDPDLDRLLRIDFSEIEKIDDFIAELYALKIVKYVEKLPLLKASTVSYPNDPFYTIDPILTWDPQWHWKMIDAQTAWDLYREEGANTKGTRLAVVDNAVWGEHEDLQIASENQYDATANNGEGKRGSSAPPSTVNQNNQEAAEKWDHGTHCMGLAGARTNNGIGVASLGDDGTGNKYWIDGFKWAVDSADAKVVSISLGGTTRYEFLQSVIRGYARKGVVVVAAAGNENYDTKTYPGAYSDVICVAAVDASGDLSSFTNYGTWVDVAAPGGSMGIESYLVSTTFSKSNLVDNPAFEVFRGKYYGQESGTSMACPITAGLVAMMKSYCDSLTPARTKEILISTSTPIKFVDSTVVLGEYMRGGIINAGRAMQAVKWYKTSISSVKKNDIRLAVYPNPAKDRVTVSAELDGETTLRIVDLSGRVVYTEQFNAANNFMREVNTSAFASGVYLVKIDNKQTSYTSKLVVR